MQYPLATISPGCYSHHMQDEDFGSRLRRLREERVISIREVSRRTGMSHSALVLLEQGKRWHGKLPPLDDLRALARALDMTVDDLTGPESDDSSARMAPPKELLSVVLERISAFPLDEEPPTELPDIALAAGPQRRGTGIVQGADDAQPRRRRRRKRDHGLFLVRIEGDCLEPRASRGDLAVFNPEQPAENGNLVVVAHGDQALVKYLAEQNAVQWLLPLVGEPIELLPEMRIVGVVKEIRRGPGRPPGVPRGG